MLCKTIDLLFFSSLPLFVYRWQERSSQFHHRILSSELPTINQSEGGDYIILLVWVFFFFFYKIIDFTQYIIIIVAKQLYTILLHDGMTPRHWHHLPPRCDLQWAYRSGQLGHWATPTSHTAPIDNVTSRQILKVLGYSIAIDQTHNNVVISPIPRPLSAL